MDTTRIPSEDATDSVHWIGAEELAIALFAYTLVPVWLTLGVASLVSPTVNVEHSQQRWHWSWAVGTGIGWSGQESSFRFSRIRLHGELESSGRSRFNLSVLADWNVLSVITAELFRLGASAGIGWQLGGESRPYVQGELWLRNAMGIWYMGLFPQHSLGLRLRYFPARSSLTPRWQVGIGWWSTFVW